MGNSIKLLRYLVITALFGCISFPASAAISCENCAEEPTVINLDFYDRYVLQLLNMDERIEPQDSKAEDPNEQPNEYDELVAT
jgi:hypothetical protein